MYPQLIGNTSVRRKISYRRSNVDATYKQLLARYPVGASIAALQNNKATVTKHGEKPMEKESMSFDPTEAREKRASLVARMQAMTAASNGGKDWSPAKEKEFNALEREIINLDEQFAAMDRVLAATAAQLQRGEYPGTASGATASTALRDLGRFMSTGRVEDLGIYGAAITEAGDGAVVVPSEIASTIMSQVQKLSPIRQVANVVSITTAHSKYTQPFSPTGAGTAWVGESDARSATTAPGLVAVEFPDSELNALISCSAWWEADAMGGAAWLVSEIAKAYARAEGAAFVAGTGVKMPRGILAATVSTDPDETRTYGELQALNSGSASTITADGLITLQYSLKPEYRANAVWLMNSATLAVVRKLKDTTGAFLWQPSLAPGQPQTLLGSPVIECGDWPDIGENAYAVAYGDMKAAYTVVDRNQTLLRDPFTARPFVLFDARKRVSGNLVDTAALKLLKIAA